jgi:hypothetical protein
MVARIFNANSLPKNVNFAVLGQFTVPDRRS